MLDMLRKGVRDDKGDVSTATSLIFAKLCQPTITPRLGVLGFPEDHAGGLTDRAIDLLNDIGTQLSLGNGFDDIHRKLAAKQLLELKLENLTLGLLRTL